VRLIANWTSDLTLFTNGPSALMSEQAALVQRHSIAVIEQPIVAIEHAIGHLHHLLLQDGTRHALTALYAPLPFVQHCTLPASLGCAINADGYITVDDFQETSVKGVYACGDNTSRNRTLANAVSMGTTAGMTVSKRMILAKF
jgi:thioredoxin reductase